MSVGNPAVKRQLPFGSFATSISMAEKALMSAGKSRKSASVGASGCSRRRARRTSGVASRTA